MTFTIKQLFQELGIVGLAVDRMNVGTLVKNQFVSTHSEQILSRVEEDGLQVLQYTNDFKPVAEDILRKYMEAKNAPPPRPKRKRRLVTRYEAI